MSDITDYTPRGPVTIDAGFAPAFANAFHQFGAFWQSLLWITLVYIVIGVVVYLPYYLYSDYGTPFSWWLVVYTVVISIVFLYISYGYLMVTMKAARGESPEMADLFRPFGRPVTVFVTALLMGIIITIGLALLIVPGIFLICRLVMVPYMVLDRGLGVGGAISGSWRLTKGYGWHVFLLILVFMVTSGVIISILSVIFGVGLLFSGGDYTGFIVYMVVISFISGFVEIFASLAIGSLYHGISLKKAGGTEGVVG